MNASNVEHDGDVPFCSRPCHLRLRQWIVGDDVNGAPAIVIAGRNLQRISNDADL